MFYYGESDTSDITLLQPLVSKKKTTFQPDIFSVSSAVADKGPARYLKRTGKENINWAHNVQIHS